MIRMLAKQKKHTVTSDEYLKGEIKSKVKHQLIQGEAYAMAGASANHERISTNLSAELYSHLKNSPCEPFGSDMKVNVGNDFFYPDVIVDGEFDESTPYYTKTPKIIFEVLSKSTRRIDETIKRNAYISIPTLQEFVLIEQDIVDIEVVRREQGWMSKHYFMGDQVTFTSLGLTLSVADIYQRVKNDDVNEYLEQLQAELNNTENNASDSE